MRTSRAPRTLTAALVVSGALIWGTAASAGTAAAHDDESPVRGVVVAHGQVNLRADRDTGATIVGSLPPGARVRIDCAAFGGYVDGNPYWYWLGRVDGWASGAYVKPERQAPMCDDRNQSQHQSQYRHQHQSQHQHQHQHQWHR